MLKDPFHYFLERPGSDSAPRCRTLVSVAPVISVGLLLIRTSVSKRAVSQGTVLEVVVALMDREGHCALYLDTSLCC